MARKLSKRRIQCWTHLAEAGGWNVRDHPRRNSRIFLSNDSKLILFDMGRDDRNQVRCPHDPRGLGDDAHGHGWTRAGGGRGDVALFGIEADHGVGTGLGAGVEPLRGSARLRGETDGVALLPQAVADDLFFLGVGDGRTAH